MPWGERVNHPTCEIAKLVHPPPENKTSDAEIGGGGGGLSLANGFPEASHLHGPKGPRPMLRKDTASHKCWQVAGGAC